MGRKIIGFERIAIWTAHSKKCAYCKEPLKYADLEIEHIIPASLAEKPQELQKLLADLELPPDFDLDSHRNLLPAHGRCNSQKGAWIFSQPNIRFFLEMARQRLDTIRTLIPSLEIEASRERLLAIVQSALRSGTTNLEEMLEAAVKTDGFPLNASVEFESGIWEVRAEREKINELLDEPIDLKVQGRENGVRLKNGKGSEKSIRTCREYMSAIAAGFYPSDNMELKVSFSIATASAILEAASRAKLAPNSCIRTPRLGVTSLSLLPASLAPTKYHDGSAIIWIEGAKTIQELSDSGLISAQSSSEFDLTIEFQDHGLTLTELMRADFDDDGVEEILVKIHSYIKFATFRSLSIGLLRRRDPASMFEYQLWNSAIEMAQRRHQIARIMR